MILTERDIYEIYIRYVKSNDNYEYNNRYNPLPLQFNDQKWNWEGKDFPRIIALLEFKRFMEKYNFEFNDVISFNGDSDPEYQYLKYKNITNINYVENPIDHDLHNLNLHFDKKFDFAMLNQTIEHLYDPILALKNVNRYLNIGGIFYANVPANNIPHSDPFHYFTGITPTGLGCIAKLAGFEILEIGQWGNKEHLHKLFEEGWIDYTKIENFKNDFSCPMITWILAVKTK